MKRVIVLTILYATIIFGCSKNSQSGAETIPSAFQESVIEEETNDNIVSSDSVITTSSNSLQDSIGIDFKGLGVTEYEYPEEFVLEDDIKWAIEQVAKQDYYCQDITNTEVWKNYFLNSFIVRCNFRSYKYLSDYEDENGWLMSKDQVEYVQYSLSGKYVSFDDMEDTVECYGTWSTPMKSFNIDDYEYEFDGDDVLITADATYRLRGKSYDKYYIIHARLTPNIYSCFNGYSIVDIQKEEIKQYELHDDKEHVFCAELSFDGIIDKEIHFEPVETTNDDLCYGMFVVVEGTEEQINYVLDNENCTFKVTWLFDEDMEIPISKIKAKNIEVIE